LYPYICVKLYINKSNSYSKPIFDLR